MYVCKKRLKKFLSLRKICANFHPSPLPPDDVVDRRVNNWRKTEDWLGRSTNGGFAFQANLPMTISINRGGGYIDTS